MIRIWFKKIKCHILQTHEWVSLGCSARLGLNDTIPEKFVKRFYKCIWCGGKMSILQHMTDWRLLGCPKSL